MIWPMSRASGCAITNDTGTAISQLISPCSAPSIMKMPMRVRERAPIARSTPISRVRSTTPMLRLPASPIPPTVATSAASPINIPMTVANWFAA